MRNLKVVFYARLYAPAPLQAELGRSLSHCILGLVVLLLGGWTLFFHLGEGSLNDWDEATYAEIAREMVTRGDWITPYWNGAPFHDKPPLVIWFMAAGMTIIKSPELAARLPSAIAGLFAIATTILLGRVLFCLWTGLTAAVLLLVSSKSWWVNFVMLARQGMLDVPLTGFTIWAFLHLYRGIQRPQHWLLMGLPLGLAMLTKSFLTLPIVLTIVIFVIVLVLQGQPFSRMHWRYAAGCVTLALTVSLPWHLVQVVQHGNDFFDGYVLIHFMKTQRPEAGNLGAKSFYLIAIGQALPYLAWLGVPAIAFAVWRILRFRDNRALLLAVWIAVPLLLFSPIPTKLPWYVVPVLPALVLAIAALFRAAIPQRWIAETFFLATLVFFVAIWNIRVLKPLDASRDVKALGGCVNRITPIREEIAYYDPSSTDDPEVRRLWNIRPSILVYGRSPMVRIRDTTELEQWIGQGGRFVWTEESFAGQLPGSFRLIVAVGNQQYFRLRDGSRFENDCSVPDANER